MSAYKSGLLMAVTTAMYFGGGLVRAEAAPMDLMILPNGHVRIDNGPELDTKQLKTRIAEFKRQHPQPDIAPHPAPATPFGAVAIVVQTIQDAKYGDHLVFAGTTQGK